MTASTFPVDSRMPHGVHRSISSRFGSLFSWWRRLVATPLLRKLVFADLIINVLALYMIRHAPAGAEMEIMVVALFLTVALNAVLVYWALLPLRALEAVTLRVSRGDLDARCEMPDFVDRNIARIGITLNALLDRLTTDRARLRQLASQIISAGDAERAHIARELHDSTAQSLSALEMLLASTILREEQTEKAVDDDYCTMVSVPENSIGGATQEQLRTMHDIATQALQEVRTLSHNVHPRVLDDLGLVAAMEYLARRTRLQSGTLVRVSADDRIKIPPVTASVLYRVAQGAINNALRHARGSEIDITLMRHLESVTLEVRDNGAGFDVLAVEAARNGMGLFIMRERLALVDGILSIMSTVGSGTRILATVPVHQTGVRS